MNNVIDRNGYIGRTAGRGAYRPGQVRQTKNSGEGMIEAVCRIVRFFSEPGVKTVVAAVAVIAALVCFALYAVALLTGTQELMFADEVDCSDLFEGNQKRERILVFETC